MMGNENRDPSYSRRQWMGLAALGGVTAVSAGPRQATSETPAGPHRLALRAGELEVLVVDNHDGLAGEEQKRSRASVPHVAGGLGRLSVAVPFERRHNGYNGVARFSYRGSPHPFLPVASGLNCEFFFDGTEGTFEPRWSDLDNFQAQPSSLKRISEQEAWLRIEPGERWGVQVESTFRLVEPWFLDVEHAFTPTRLDKIRTRHLGVFWASYIQAPRNPGYYVWGRRSNFDPPAWHGIFDALDLHESGAIRAERGPVGERFRGQGRRLLYSFGSVRYVEPLMAGKVHGMLLAYLFRPSDELEVRPAFNAGGGGVGGPAWDYQAVVPDPEEGRRYSFRLRVVYKPFEALDEALDLHREWLKR